MAEDLVQFEAFFRAMHSSEPSSDWHRLTAELL